MMFAQRSRLDRCAAFRHQHLIHRFCRWTQPSNADNGGRGGGSGGDGDGKTDFVDADMPEYLRPKLNASKRRT